MWLDRLREMKEVNQKIDRAEWTTNSIAKKCGVPARTLDKIFAGATKDPKLLTMQKVVYAMGYTLDDLFNEKPLNGPGSTVGEKSIVSQIIAAAYEMATEDDKGVVDAVLKKYLPKKREEKAQ